MAVAGLGLHCRFWPQHTPFAKLAEVQLSPLSSPQESTLFSVAELHDSFRRLSSMPFILQNGRQSSHLIGVAG